jgi:hypothetical protein
MNDQPIMPLVLKAVALAMGVAVVVMSVIGAGTQETHLMLLGIGVFCLGLWALQMNR